MGATDSTDPDAATRARAWKRALRDSVGGVQEPWAHGRVLRVDRYPTVFDYNTVQVEDDPGMSAAELVAFADTALADFGHRRLDFEDAAAAAAVRPELERLGWLTTPLVWMRHEAPLPPGDELAVEEVDYDAVRDLRLTWHYEDFADEEPNHLDHVRGVAMSHNARVIATIEAGKPVGFAQIEYLGDSAEVMQVYLHPDHRGGGRGTAITRAAILAAGEVDDLWIVADDEDRPKRLYERLGFRRAWTSVEFLLLNA